MADHTRVDEDGERATRSSPDRIGSIVIFELYVGVLNYNKLSPRVAHDRVRYL